MKKPYALLFLPVLVSGLAQPVRGEAAPPTVPAAPSAKVPSALALEVARHARAAYADAVTEALAELVSFPTVHEEGKANSDLPAVRAMSAALAARAKKLGFDVRDDGAVLVIGLGQGPERLGIVAHGDVQPADPTKWKQNPFMLDAESEPGRLLGRGAQDDKGPIAATLYAMKAVADRKVELAKRIELIVSYTEESDWQPFQDWLAKNPPPQVNVVVDADYPVVIAEKGWCSIHLTLPADPQGTAVPKDGAYVRSLAGGAFLSQVPEEATAAIARATAATEGDLRDRAVRDFPDVQFGFERSTTEPDVLVVRAKGVSAHSSTPEAGTNAIAHLAGLLSGRTWPDTQAARMALLLDDLIGLGIYGEQFGKIAHEHPFMGKLTLVLSTLEAKGGTLVAGINFRRPAGRAATEVETSVREAVEAWRARHAGTEVQLATEIYDPYVADDAPQIPALLGIFEHFSGAHGARPVSVGGGTHARLLPHGVSFGPGMPGEVYTGHSEHEFITRERLLSDLEMVAAMMVELAGK